MHDLDLILTLTGSLAAALVWGSITLRLGLSPIVGYLLAGLVVGPYTPGFVADRHLAEQLAEIGVILLMFGVGLQFHVEELLAVRRVAVPGAVGRALVAPILGALAGAAFGWSWSAGLVFGVSLSMTSTVVLMRVLADSGDLPTPMGHLAVGWLVVEDLLAVLVVVLLPALFAPGIGPAGIALAVVTTLAKVAALVALTFLLGDRVIPWLLDRAAASRSRELFTLTVLVVALGIAVGSARLFGVSMALGAFLAGMIVGRTDFSLRAATEALPMRDAFAVLFFVAVGTLFRPSFLLESPGLVLATVAIVMIARPLAAFVLVVALGQPVRTALSLGLGTAQIGEFSFILESVGERLGLLDERARNAIVAAAILSITVNPLLYRLVRPLERALGRRFPQAGEGRGAAEASGLPPVSDADGRSRYRAVIVGHGPVGRTLARLLRQNRIEPVVIELNVETVRRVNADGMRAIYGDASLRDTLEAAGVADAVALILSSSSVQGMAEAVRHARALNPDIRIVARSDHLRDAARLREAGADLVFSGEGELALAMTESLLRHLRATPEEIDRERDRIRSELLADLGDIDGLTGERTLPTVVVPPSAGEDGVSRPSRGAAKESS